MSKDGRSWLGWLLGTPERPPATRLSDAEAVALAAAAPQVCALGRALPMAAVHVDGGRLVWRVSNGGVGAQTWVEVDDETGHVGQVHEVWSR